MWMPNQPSPVDGPILRRDPFRLLLLPMLAALVLAQTALGAPATKPKKVGHITAQVLADRHALVPGEELNLAVSLRPDKGWYIYWQNPGASGLPTKIRCSGPADYQIGRVRFPVPVAKFDEKLKETSYIHPGEAVFLVPVRVPDSAAAGGEAVFTVKASWLVCKKSCIPGNVTLSLTLPVVARASPTKPANAEVFEQGRAALPDPHDRAKHVKISGSLDRKAVSPGTKFTVTLTAEIAARHHMQSHKPLIEGLIPAIVFVERTPGLQIGQVEYPKPHLREDKFLGKLSEYSGKIAFRIPVEVDQEAEPGSRWIRTVLQYQVCTDAGTCFPPRYLEFAVAVPTEGGPKPVEDLAMAPPVAAVGPKPGPRPSADSEATSEDQAEAPVAEAGPVTAAVDPVPQERSLLIRIQDWLFGFNFAGVLLAGFLGGLVLNLMPCVLPVISLKVLSFVRQAHEERWRIFRLGLVYSLGIMVFFTFLAVVFYAWGTGWGELFQNPIFVMVMAAIVLAFSLSLFGVFAVFTPKVVNELGQKAEAQEGYLSAFGTGLLATLLGTACTAPFLSAAIGYAVGLPVAQGVSIFLAAGLGMASPFVVLTYNPSWLRFVPRPGPWMGVFEAVMGFVLMATVIWLVNPLRVQLGAYGLLLALIFLLAVAIAVWIKGRIEFGAPLGKKVRLYAIALAVVAGGWLLPFRTLSTVPELIAEQIEHHDLLARGMREKYGKSLDWSKGIPWQPYVRELAMADVRDGYTVFVDYTATWCASCKSNLKAFIERSEVIGVMRELNILPYEADYSLYNPEIKRDLERYGRAGVPMYLVYRPGDTESPELLPELLTKKTIIDALRRAGPSRVEIADSSGKNAAARKEY